MAEPGTYKTQLVRDFKGEDTAHPESVLPPNVSPEAINVIYRDGTLAKRAGLVRRQDNQQGAGALVITNMSATGTASSLVIPANVNYCVEGKEFHRFTFEFFVRFDAWPATGDLWLARYRVAAAGGWQWYIKLNCLDKSLSAQFLSTGDPVPTWAVTWAEYALELGVTYRICLSMAKSAKYFLALSVQEYGEDEEIVYGTELSDEPTLGQGPLHLLSDGTTPAGLDLHIDEIRLWSGASVDPYEPVWYELGGLDELALIGYWPVSLPLSELDVVVDVTVDANDAGVTGTCYHYGIGLLPFHENFPGVLGLFLAPEDSAQGYRTICGTHSDLFRGEGWAHLVRVPAPSFNRWSGCLANNFLVLTSGGSENYRYNATAGLSVLTPSVPDASATTATEGAGTGLTGVRKYRFRFVFSSDMTRGTSSTDEVSSPDVTNKSIDVDGIPVSVELGVDKVEILATRMNQDVYYHHSYITNGTTSIEDTTQDGTLLIQEDPYIGRAEGSLFCVAYNGMVVLGNQEDTPYRLVFTEPGTCNAFYYENYIDLGAGDGDPLTGAVACQGALLVTKRHSLWYVTGSGPQSLAANLLYQGVGCVNHATIAASPSAIYFMAARGIMRLPLPFGSGPPEEITKDRMRAVFANLTEDEYVQATAIWDPTLFMYRLSFRRQGVPRTIIFHEPTGTFCRTDHDVGGYAAVSASGNEPQILGGWRGYVARLGTGGNDGLDLDGEATITTVSGTVDSAGDCYLVDADAGFPVSVIGTLGGCNISVISATTGLRQTRIIEGNTANRLWINVVWDWVPALGDTYYLAGVDCSWRSPRLFLSTDPSLVARTSEIRVWFRSTQDIDVQCTHVMDSSEKSVVLDGSRRLNAQLIPNQGREFYVAFENNLPNERFEIEAFQLRYQEGGE